MSRRGVTGVVVAGLILGVAGPLGSILPASTTPSADAAERPNVLLILTDDQRAGSLVGMPTVTEQIVAAGTSYPNSFVPTSWCCPSRASLLSGKFAHNSGVWENASSSAWGAWSSFANGGEEADTLATRMDDAGYRTGLFGKYLNDVTSASEEHVPPGWDEWSAFLGGNYTRYKLSTDRGRAPKSRKYLTDELANRTIDFIRSTPKGKPFFAYFAPFAPHYPYDPGPYAGAIRKAGLLDDLHAATNFPSASTNQADMSAYPRWMQKLQSTDQWGEDGRRKSLNLSIEEVVERQADTLMGVDAAIARMIDTLRKSGQLDNTLIVFVSDNGYAWGEHRLQGKNTPYDVSVRVPLAMRYDGVLPAGAVDERAVAANVDVHASILDMVGIRPAKIDGISVRSPAARDGVVMEAMRWTGRRGRPAYCGYRTPDRLYVRYSTGEEELYDYTVDPLELNNVAADPAYAQDRATLQQATRRACSPTPPGFAWDSREPRLKPPTVVQATWVRDDRVRITWRAPSGVGERVLSFVVVAVRGT
jgi:N-acetylglucosamine-6-sulfatase